MKELCKCGEIALWLYMPASCNKLQIYFCDNCVPRGCTCHYRYVDVNGVQPPLDKPDLQTDQEYPFKWIQEDCVWVTIDDKGREYPCIEYDYDADGYDKPEILLMYYCDKYRHLVCKPFSIENLHIMAADLKIGKHFFEYSEHGRLPHYDIPAERISEITSKCILVTRFEIVNIIKNGL